MNRFSVSSSSLEYKEKEKHRVITHKLDSIQHSSGIQCSLRANPHCRSAFPAYASGICKNKCHTEGEVTVKQAPSAVVVGEFRLLLPQIRLARDRVPHHTSIYSDS